ncbi:MAG TPA: TetR/AcrR family transcriptional regulator [Jatrophihabitans sp.]|jgi:AcrR family transcriptional regulator
MRVAARKPGRPRDEALGTAILDAAVDEFIDKGYAGLSMEGIAARAGVAKTTIYRRWPTMEDLAVAAVCSLGKDEDEPLPAGDTARGELLQLLEQMRRKWTDPRYGALMRRAAADGTRQPEVYAQMRERIVGSGIAAMNRALARAVDEGIIGKGVDLTWVRQLLTAPILAATLTLKHRVSARQIEFTLDTVLAGLVPEPS